MTQTRRGFLQGVAAAGGYGAAYVSMQALGLLPTAAFAEPLTLERGRPHGTSVVILGAGIAGLCAAYELRKAGYDCTVLEARDRAGGRNWTVRHGTTLAMHDGHGGMTTQTCAFDKGLYWNAGPARLPSIHHTVLGYCRELGVPLEVEINTSRSAMLTNANANAGKPIEMRQAANDTRGAVSELLAKAIDRGALDQELTAADKERVFAFLKQYGDLTPDKLYKGSSRSGWKVAPGGGEQAGVPRDPVSLNVLLDADLWNGVLFEDLIDQQATMFQPVGGMDRIPMAFAKALGSVVKYGCEVTEIRRRADRAHVAWRDKRTGRMHAIEADYCISTIPQPVLATIPADFSPRVAEAIGQVEWQNSVKIAWQSRRFWEQDDNIYGGISWVKGVTNMVWYPSADLFADQGIVLGSYTSGDNGARMAAYPMAQQFEMTREVIERLHPGRGKELRRPMGINWSSVPYSLGEAVRWREEQADVYRTLNAPDGPFYFAQDGLAKIGTWQEAAMTSARRAINAIDTRRRSLVKASG